MPRTHRRFTAEFKAEAVKLSRGTLEFLADPASPYHDKAFDPARPVIFYCAVGGRSALGADLMRELGYTNVAHLEGGFTAWKAAGRAVEGPGEPGAAPRGWSRPTRCATELLRAGPGGSARPRSAVGMKIRSTSDDDRMARCDGRRPVHHAERSRSIPLLRRGRSRRARLPEKRRTGFTGLQDSAPRGPRSVAATRSRILFIL